jgi:putative SOS response-associated peptidase YedK
MFAPVPSRDSKKLFAIQGARLGGSINARAETVLKTPSFREPFKSQRYLIPAEGFYEWQKNGKTKQPYCCEVNDGEVFAFAGLWDR